MESSTSDAIWATVVYGLHAVGGLYVTGAIRDVIRARSIAGAPDCRDLSKLDLSKPTGLVKVHGWIRSPDPIRNELSPKPVVILSHVHTGRYVSYYGALREMFLSQDVRVAPFFVATSSSDDSEQLWISRQFSASLPRIFCPDLLNTISEKTEQVRPFWSSFVAALLSVRLPFEHIERVSVLPDNCEAVVISKIERDSSNRVRLSRTPWWSLFPPDVAVVTTSSVEDIVEDFQTRAVERSIAATGFFAFGFLMQYLRRNQ